VDGHDEYRVGESVAHGGEYALGGAGVEASGWFVDEQDVGLGGQGAGDVEAALFAAGHAAPADADPGLRVEPGVV